VCYCDDLLICTKSDDPLEHRIKSTALLDTLREHKLLIKGSKIELVRTQVEFLGFDISTQGLAPTKSKVTAVVEWSAPQTVKHLWSFLGMPHFFRTVIDSFSNMVAPLFDLFKESGPVLANLRGWWFEFDQAALTLAPVLRHFDPHLHTAVHIDCIQNAVGAVLLQ